MCRNPLSALATIMPVSPVVTSWMVVVNPPGVSYRLTTSSSPGFMTRTSGVGVKVCSVAVSGPGGPIGAPDLVRNAKFAGSMQFTFCWANPNET